jgi:hypothetical protein
MRSPLPPLPITISFGRPGRRDLGVSVGALGVLLAGLISTHAAAGSGLTLLRPSATPPTVPDTLLTVTASVIGASVTIDGQPIGLAPVSSRVTPGQHLVTAQYTNAVAETQTIQAPAEGSGVRVALTLWRSYPAVRLLQPTLPGAAIVNATFLTDGRLGLVVNLPGDERQAWTLDPADHGAVDRLGSVAPRAPLAIPPDGTGTAFLHSSSGRIDASLTSFDRLAEVWLADVGDDQGHPVWSVDQPDEQLVNLAWAPDSRHLLVIGRQQPGLGMERTSLRWLDTTTGAVQLLALLPSEVIPGSYLWRPDGHAFAFLVHTASLSAVCTLSDTGDFHYLGDLGHDGTAGPPVAPVAWGPDGQLVYAALEPASPSASSSPLGLNALPVGLFQADPNGGPGRPFGSQEGLAPIWWPDGRLLLAGLPSDRGTGLRLRQLDAPGQAHEVVSVDVPTPAGRGYGLRWDLTHQRALLVTNHSSFDGGHDYALLDFGWSDPD